MQRTDEADRTHPGASAHAHARRRAGLGALGATLLGVAAIAAPAQGAGIGIPGSVDFANPDDPLAHFPAHYEDDEGQRVELCIDVLDLACGAVTPPDPTQPVRFSETNPGDNNFPDEAFYQRAQAIVGTNIQLTLAQETTFDGTNGSQVVFGRVRIRDLASELTPGQWYRFTYPGGAVDLQAGDAARPVNFSSDIGCGPAIGPLCDSLEAFAAPAASEIGSTFLQKDRATGAAPPAGYLADVGLQAVVGSSYVPPGETQPANYFRVQRISDQGGAVLDLVGQTQQFDLLVPGKLHGGGPAGMLLASDGSFGGQRVAAPGSRTVTLRNGGSGSVELDGLAIGGPDASQFALDAAGCGGGTTTLAAGQSCDVAVTFTPSASGPREARIEATQINTPAGTRIRGFRLLGTGIEPILSVPSLLAFGNQVVGGTVGPRTVEVRNTGTDVLNVGAVTLAGVGAGDYALGMNACTATAVAPGSACAVEVFFRPTTVGARAARLDVASDAGTRSVAVDGAGVATTTQVTVVAGDPGPAGPAAPLPGPLGVPVTASFAPPLSLTSLRGATRVKRAKATRTGIRLAIRVKDGTQVLQIKVYRGTGRTRRLLSSGFKTTGRGTLVRISQNHLALRRAFRVLGRYEVEVRPGRSTSDLGTGKRLAFRIVK